MPTLPSETQTKRPQDRPLAAAPKHPIDDLLHYWKEYARERPEVCAMWCFGIGFVLGWKLKPW